MTYSGIGDARDTDSREARPAYHRPLFSSPEEKARWEEATRLTPNKVAGSMLFDTLDRISRLVTVCESRGRRGRHA